MPKNKIEDLRNLMMETMERLLDPDDPMDAKKAAAAAQLGSVIVNSAKVELHAARLYGNQNPEFFQNSKKLKQIPTEVKQLPESTSTASYANEDEMPDCKCGSPIYPGDFDRSTELALDYPRCRECLSLLPTNGRDLNGGGK